MVKIQCAITWNAMCRISKIIVLKGGQADKLMEFKPVKDNFRKSTAAAMLREIVARTFKVAAKNVILSGEISPDAKVISYEGHSWADGYALLEIWGYSPEHGFKSLSVPSYYSQNGESVGDQPCALADIVNGDEIFFLFHLQEQDQNGNKEESWTLHKSPDLQKYWTDIEVADIERWKQWLG